MPPTYPEYKRMHAAFKDLGIDKYEMLSDRYDIESAKKLTRSQLKDLFNHLRSLGWQAKRGKKSTASPVYKKKQMRKIVALWITLADEGVVKNRSDQALQHYVKRMTKKKKENLRFCDSDECHLIIEALKAWAKREDVELE